MILTPYLKNNDIFCTIYEWIVSITKIDYKNNTFNKLENKYKFC